MPLAVDLAEARLALTVAEGPVAWEAAAEAAVQEQAVAEEAVAEVAEEEEAVEDVEGNKRSRKKQ